MLNLPALIDWAKCPDGKVPVVVQRDFGAIQSVAWLGADEVHMMLQLELAIAHARKNPSRFFVDCDGDALVHRCFGEDLDDFWRKFPSVHWPLFLQSSHDVRVLLQPESLWEKTYNGLLPAVIQDKGSREILMVAWINREAWADCMLRGSMCFFSRSKGRLWRKGEESGNTQVIKECGIFAGANLPPTVLFVVEQIGGAACHDGYQRCFYRRVDIDQLTVVGERVFDPAVVYNK